MVCSFSLHMEGLSPAALDLNLAADRVCVGGRNVFKVFGINIPDQDDQVAVIFFRSLSRHFVCIVKLLINYKTETLF